jgi:hypothetical protein
MSTRDRTGAESRVLSDDSSRIDLMSALTWSPIRFGRVLPIMIPIFFGWDIFAVVSGVELFDKLFEFVSLYRLFVPVW